MNEKELKECMSKKNKEVVIDFVCQYKWERDFFESQNKLHEESFDLAVHNLTCLYNELLGKSEPTKEEVEAMKNLLLSTAKKVINDKDE